MKKYELKRILTGLANKYPKSLQESQLADIDRIAFHIESILAKNSRTHSICDIGGGIGLFSVGCAAIGIQTILVDDFEDEVNKLYGDAVLDLHRKYGVEIISVDVINQPIELKKSSLDAVTTFDSMEHWHHSPKKLFHNAVRALKPDGILVIGVPNSVNLRKRITVPFGSGKWSSMDAWYEAERFRGHVREPDVGDLRYIGYDLNLKAIEIIGRNWLGYHSKFKLVRKLTRIGDHALRLRPSLCSDIYLIGRKKS